MMQNESTQEQNSHPSLPTLLLLNLHFTVQRWAVRQDCCRTCLVLFIENRPRSFRALRWAVLATRPHDVFQKQIRLSLAKDT